ncbi:universal stress protein [Salinadaptatus halalkaliphilus]|uniref:Universal stress protein n=1 Tax=Salinadaptatus halalkaliphilus TaxID=2419781 RepID=A0A4S3TP32_9EURY|nr:universal stress protein [Salinadaptatus halalkaliphilus]THE65966.1 universal stress protein [Salinadaptatus halalkaliphilus]
MPIVAAVDQSDSTSDVLTEAEALATATGEPLHVVHVLTRKKFREIEQTSVEETGTAVPMEEVRSFATKIADEAAEGVVSEYEPIGLVGDPADGLLNYIETNDIRYIVLGGRKRSAVGKAIFGSTAQPVLMDASCPVVTVTRDES